MAIIGIDLGTTNSLASVFKDGKIQLIPNSFGEYLTPSVVSFGDNDEVYVGKIAKEMLVTNPLRTFCEFKRNMGTNYMYKVGDKSYRAEELSAFVLMRLKEDAENFLGEEVTEAVVSVPAYFNDDKRCATKNAGILAGLNVERLINEPSAVALKHHINFDEAETFLIFDFGGGTLDVSLVDAFDNMVEIVAVAGDNYLGGKDFNEIIAEEFYRQNNLLKNILTPKEQGIVLKEAEEAKKELTIKNEVERKFYLSGAEFILKITNQQLIHISKKIFQRMSKPIEKVINDSNMTFEEIDKIILVGGSSKMPVVVKYIESIADTEVVTDSMPDESIALGVGMAAAIKMRKGEIKDMILADICPFSLGTEVYDGTFSPIIQRNETLPCSRSSYYVTTKDNQTELTFPIYQGENIIARENLKLGELKIRGLPKRPKGEIGANVTFMYDINGILDIKIKSDDNQTVHKLIMNKRIGLNDEQLKAYIEKLEKMTMHPIEKEENKMLIEKANRLYEEANPETRMQILSMLRYFNDAMTNYKGKEAREAFLRFLMFLESVEADKQYVKEFNESFWTEDDDEEEDEY